MDCGRARAPGGGPVAGTLLEHGEEVDDEFGVEHCDVQVAAAHPDAVVDVVQQPSQLSRWAVLVWPPTQRRPMKWLVKNDCRVGARTVTNGLAAAGWRSDPGRRAPVAGWRAPPLLSVGHVSSLAAGPLAQWLPA